MINETSAERQPVFFRSLHQLRKSENVDHRAIVLAEAWLLPRLLVIEMFYQSGDYDVGEQLIKVNRTIVFHNFFNPKVERVRQDLKYEGRFWFGERNEREACLITIAEGKKLRCYYKTQSGRKIGVNSKKLMMIMVH